MFLPGSRNASRQQKNERGRRNSMTITKRRSNKFPLRSRTTPGPPLDRQLTPPQKRNSNKLVTCDEAQRFAANVAKLPELLQRRSNKAVLTVVGAVYGGVNLSWRRLGGTIRHGSISYRARSDSRDWRCFFPVRDRV